MKQITLDEETKKHLLSEFEKYIQNTKLTDNRINFTTNITPTLENIKRPTIYINSTAYLKMMLYVRDTDVEIAWHGTVERNLEHNFYYIKDVFLYPQIIRSATVDTDQKKYNDWMDTLDDETFNTMRFQGHSHVNMSTSPSSVDLQMYENFLQVLQKNDYYIFMILNKRGEFNCYIYDLAKNLIYDTEDIDVKIITKDSNNLLKEIKEAKDKLCEKPIISYPTYPRYDSYNYKDDYFKYPSTSKTDVNTLIDEINNKFKNPKCKLTKKQKKEK